MNNEHEYSILNYITFDHPYKRTKSAANPIANTLFDPMIFSAAAENVDKALDVDEPETDIALDADDTDVDNVLAGASVIAALVLEAFEVHLASVQVSVKIVVSVFAVLLDDAADFETWHCVSVQVTVANSVAFS